MEWKEMFGRLVSDPEDPLAWTHLQRQVRGWARREFGRQGWHLVEDAVADTASAVAVGLERAYGAETFRGFVFGHFLTARRQLLRVGRVSLLPLDNVDIAAAGSDDAPFNEETLSSVMRALATLPPRERQAGSLRHLEGLPASAIAAELGVSPENARLIVHRGLQRLRRGLK